MRTPSRQRPRLERNERDLASQQKPKTTLAATLLRAAAKLDKAIANELRTTTTQR